MTPLQMLTSSLMVFWLPGECKTTFYLSPLPGSSHLSNLLICLLLSFSPSLIQHLSSNILSPGTAVYHSNLTSPSSWSRLPNSTMVHSSNPWVLELEGGSEAQFIFMWLRGQSGILEVLSQKNNSNQKIEEPCVCAQACTCAHVCVSVHLYIHIHT